MNIKSRKARWICGILAVVFIAVGIAMIYSLRLKEIERKHIEYVERLDGFVQRSDLFPLWVYYCLAPQLHKFIPEGPVWRISFESEYQVTDGDIAPVLKGFPDLVYLNLSGSRITDETLKAVPTLPKLLSIPLNGTKVTDKGVEFLSQSRSLIQLPLDDTNISDESIVHLSQMKQLRWLSFAGTPLTDKSVDILCNMPNLQHLNIKDTKISNEGFERLEKKFELVIY